MRTDYDKTVMQKSSRRHPHGAELRAREPAVSQSAGARVNENALLVVEDNPASLKLLRLVLSLEGFDVLAATTAEEAIGLMLARTPRAVIADIQLPGMSGLELARAVRANPAWDDVVLVAVTAHATKRDEQRALAAGFAGLLRKPIDTGNIGSLIRQLLVNHTGPQGHRSTEHAR